jgi:hypothetical protein
VRRKRRQGVSLNPLVVTGEETYFEAVKLVMAALTLNSEGEREKTWATEAMLALEPRIAVAALWTVLGTTLSGFDSKEEERKAIQLMAESLARMEVRGAAP